MAEVNTQTQATEPTTQQTAEPVTEPKTNEPAQAAQPKQKEPTVQELLVELAKYKRSSEKNASEAAEWKKKFNSTLSEKEIADQQKAEAEAKRDEEYKALLRKDKIHDLTENFMGLGYPKDEAKKAAAAQVDGDTDALFKIQAEVDAQKKKSWEAEFLKNRPQPQVGVGGEKPTMSKEDFNKLFASGKYAEIMQFKETYPQTYAEYMK